MLWDQCTSYELFVKSSSVSSDRPSSARKGSMALLRVHPKKEGCNRLLQTDIATHDAEVPGCP